MERTFVFEEARTGRSHGAVELGTSTLGGVKVVTAELIDESDEEFGGWIVSRRYGFKTGVVE